MITNSSQKRIIFLDYLRVFAFMSVLIGHKFYQDIVELTGTLHTPHITQQYFINIFLSMFMGGGAGVIVFFMISGYIILHVLQSEAPIEFIIKRVFRIYPLLIFAIFIEMLLAKVPVHILTAVQQMSLLGDFFKTPLALAGVEWTLRIEILFYFLMFLLSFSFVIKKKNYLLLAFFTLFTFVLYYNAPFPTVSWHKAYLSMYFPFLFLGSTLYMYERKTINLYALSSFVIIVFYLCFKLTEQYQTNWLQTNFIIVGFLVFLGFWALRNKHHIITATIDKMIIKISLLTYSIYLFHNFLWSYIENFLQTFGIHSKVSVLILLIVWCYMVHKLIELPMNRLGKKIATERYMITSNETGKKQ